MILPSLAIIFKEMKLKFILEAVDKLKESFSQRKGYKGIFENKLGFVA